MTPWCLLISRHYDFGLLKVAEFLYAECKTNIEREFGNNLSFSLFNLYHSLKKKNLSASLMEIFEIFRGDYSAGILSPVYKFSGSINLNTLR